MSGVRFPQPAFDGSPLAPYGTESSRTGAHRTISLSRSFYVRLKKMKRMLHNDHHHGTLSPEAYHAAHRHEPLSFPHGFAWGTATSAHQVEGHNVNNDWWSFEREAVTRCQKRKGKNCLHLHASGAACDHWNRFREDFDLVSGMGSNAYRLSLEWSRIEPRPGEFDTQVLIHYRTMLASLRERGIKTMVTLHHFTNPQWFVERGGWTRSQAPELFSCYVERVASELGDFVDWWITFNEPLVYATQGWLSGAWPPGKKNHWSNFGRVVWHLAQAHRRAWRTLKKITAHTPVGVAHNVLTIQVYRKHNFLDQWFAQVVDALWNHSFLFLTRPRTHDFIGLNYYFHYRLGVAHLRSLKFFVDIREEDREASDIGWEVYPPGMADVILDFTSYQKPIYITENGIATENDDRRVRFLISYLKEVYHAIQAGADVRGYFYWSLLDNFEWEKGFGPRFGLIHIDFSHDLKRTLKPSSEIYARIARENAIAHDLLRYLGHEVKIT